MTIATEALDSLRVRGGLDVEFAVTAGRTRAMRVQEADGYRVRFPALPGPCQAIVLNTGGGVAGGDRIDLNFALGVNAAAVVTTIAAERVYRSLGQPARLDIRLRLDPASMLCWLPQETILYDGARLVRNLQVEMAADARLMLVDCIVLGRRGSGERVTTGALHDRWTITQAGRPIHIEALRLDGAIDDLTQRSAVTAGAHVIAVLIYVAADATDRLESVRSAISAYKNVAASAWNGKLVLRGIGCDPSTMRSMLAAAAQTLTGRPVPRAWQC